MAKRFFNKFTRKDVFYILLILGIVLAFGAYNLRYKVLETKFGQYLYKVAEEINPSVREHNLKNANYPRPSLVLSRDELKELVIEETPVLKKRNITDFEKVSALREWTFQNVPIADSELILKNISSVSPNELPLTTRFAIYREGLSGSWCGTTAETLREVYNLFGYESYNVGQGDKIIADTHTVNIVKVEIDGQKIWSVQDPYINYDLTDHFGKPRDYFEVLSNLRLGQRDKIYTQFGENDGRYQKPYLVKKRVEKGDVLKTTTSGNMVQKRLFQGYFDLIDRSKPLFIENNYPTDFIYIYLLPFGIWGQNQERADLLFNIAKSISRN